MKRGETRLLVETSTPVKTLNLLAKDGIELRKVKKSNKNAVIFTIKTTDKLKTFAILEKLCYTYSVEADFGFFSLLKKAAFRAGLVVGTMIFSAMGIIFSQLVLFVKPDGLSPRDAIKAERALKEKFAFPIFKSSISLAETERVLISLPELAACTVKIEGNYLVISALKNFDPSENPTKIQITATSDAVVTRIIANKGSALVKIGDVVKKGDLLISGEVYSSDGQELIATLSPEGTVYGEVVYRAQCVLTEQEKVKRYTGRKKSLSAVYFGKKPTLKAPFKQCDVTEKVSPLFAIMPLWYVQAEFREYVLQSNSVDFQKKAEQMLTELKLSAIGTVLSEKYELIDLGGGVKKISAYLIVEEKISS